MAVLTPSQRARRRRFEAVIGRAAPVLDLVLFAADRVSRVVGRNQIDPEPPRRLLSHGGSVPTPLGGWPESER